MINIIRTLYTRVFSSPFKRPKLKWYFGKVTIGTPYFLPRRWKKDTQKPGYQKAVTKRIGFDFVELGWKTKWTDTDFRFEWAPIWSFVFFKWQIAIIFKAPEQNHYWECWLYYTHATDKTKSIRERIDQAREGFPCIWKSYSNGVETTICYWDIILRSKYSNVKQYNRDIKLKKIGIK
jgi:hypothetical protein